MKNHFIISYFGNKRNEVEDLFNLIKDKINGITTVVEPFCGSSAFSYYLSLQYPKKFNYILNDNSEHLIEIYKILQDEKKTLDLINKLNNIHSNIFKKENVEKRKEEFEKLKKIDNFCHWLYFQKIYSIRPGMYPLKEEERYKNYNFNDILKAPIINFLRTENIKFTNECGVKIFNLYGHNQNNFIFLDPPYLQTCNDYYQNKDANIYEYLYKNNINNYLAHIILILEDIWIIRLLFEKNKILQTTNKTYQTTKKKTTHITISNK